jgi:anti-anti-sigma factor
MSPVQRSLERKQQEVSRGFQEALASRYQAIRSRAAKERSRKQAVVAHVRDARATALAQRLSSRPRTHFARIKGEVAGEKAVAVVRYDGSATGELTWLSRAQVQEQSVTAPGSSDNPLFRTLTLSRSCERLLDVELQDVGYQYAPLRRIARACASDTTPNVEDATDVGGAEPLSILTTSHGDGVRLSLQGELDLATAPRLLTALQEAFADSHSEVVLDISGLGFIDWTGISLFVAAHKQAAAADGMKFVLSSPTPEFSMLLELVGLGTFFEFES